MTNEEVSPLNDWQDAGSLTSMHLLDLPVENISTQLHTVSDCQIAVQEMLAALGRKRYKEAFLKDALKWKVRGSCLDSRWHIRDLLGRGSISQSKTTSGPLLRLVRKK